MDNNLIANTIKDIRKKNKLTQEELANELSVTFQAVSKWERGISIPDVEILKLISIKYDIDLNQLLGINKNKKNNVLVIIGLVILFIIIGIVIFLIIHHNNDSVVLKTISTTCDNFEINGSIAYTHNYETLSIQRINYCGDDADFIFKKIECSLYKIDNNVEIKINSKEDINLSLKDFLSKLSFSVDSSDNNCNNLSKNELKLIIKATNSGDKTIEYSIPLELESTCKK